MHMENSDTFPQNPALAPFEFLIGKWNVEMKHVALPHPLEWVDSFEWLANGFILWHWQGKNEVPKATSIIGRNEHTSGNLYNIFYYDTRGISRLLEVSLENGIWKTWRNGADFFQRTEYTIHPDGKSFTGIGELSEDNGAHWKHDFSITYTKIT